MVLQYPQKRSASLRGGFSLLEIIVVLTLAAVVLGAAVVMIGAPKEEQALREEHGKIEDMVRQGRALAATYQQPFVIELTQSEARLRPVANPNEAEDDDQEPSGLKRLSEFKWPRIEALEEEYEIAIRRWGKPDFEVLDGKEVERWVLQPETFCEPLALRLSKDFGDISLARVYHPLTGMAEDEQMTITTKR